MGKAKIKTCNGCESLKRGMNLMGLVIEKPICKARVTTYAPNGRTLPNDGKVPKWCPKRSERGGAL